MTRLRMSSWNENKKLETLLRFNFMGRESKYILAWIEGLNSRRISTKNINLKFKQVS